jgi:hypothetical protein
MHQRTGKLFVLGIHAGEDYTLQRNNECQKRYANISVKVWTQKLSKQNYSLVMLPAAEKNMWRLTNEKLMEIILYKATLSHEFGIQLLLVCSHV